MNNRLGKEEMANSQSAIKGYMDFREENHYRHKAYVLISSNGKNLFNNILYVSMIIESGDTYVIVEGNNEYARDFYGKYTYEYQKFKLIGGTLIIQATDRWENTIEIDITAV